ncbi:MAG: AAA family ATPase [bacterium]|nr:AAA family ATPase [bacterium]
MPKQHRILAIANSKGGVGKSTLATNLAVEAALAGLDVLLVDTDPQSSSAVFAATRDEGRPAFGLVQMNQPILHRELPKLCEPYDLVVIDTGARETRTFRSALMAADSVLVPVTPSAYDIWASEDVFAVIDELSATRDFTTRVVLNQVVPRTKVAVEAMEALEEITEEQGAKLLDTRIHSRVAWKMASGEGLSVTEYRPRSPAAAELRALWAELDLA